MKVTSIAALALLALQAQAADTKTAADRAAAKPDPNGNLIGLTTANGKLVYNFINMWFNEHKAEAAWDQYVARKGYMNHAVYNATKSTMNKTFEQEKAEEARAAGPNTKFDIKQIVAQGNLVFVHIAATNGEGGVGPATGMPQGAAPAGAPANAGAGGPAPGGMAPGGAPPAGGMGGGGQSGDGKGPDEMLMILRVKDGKIVDHWDVHVPTNSDSVVFEGLDRQLP
ncbi:MAG: hypothetical protein QM808_14265 [Steroidobacteraceae bacterium]